MNWNSSDIDRNELSFRYTKSGGQVGNIQIKSTPVELTEYHRHSFVFDTEKELLVQRLGPKVRIVVSNTVLKSGIRT